MSAILTYVMTASAMITAGAATAGANYLRLMKQKVEENEERSKRNRELLTGEDAYHDGVIHRLNDIEDQEGSS